MNTNDFRQTMFRNYYMRDYSPKSYIPKIAQREFGFITFEGWMQRHKSFKHADELKEFLQIFAPSDAYYSCAYYDFPEAEMDKKEWQGADLIFDIDADHIPTSCDKIHDKWICDKCGFSGKGVTPEKCPICNGEKFTVSTWPCEVCLNSAKNETLKLLDMLTSDFGFSKKEIRVFFSGHRGYHVNVESEAIKTLDAVVRKEIVDYVSCFGMDMFLQDFSKKSTREAYVQINNFGWLKRLSHGIENFILNAKDEDLKKIGLKRNVVDALRRDRESIIKNLHIKGKPIFVKGVGSSSLKKIVEYVVQLQSSKIDTVVTTDIHRLIRLADTLHGKTGFKKVELCLSDLETFDPFKEAIAFKKDKVMVNVSEAPAFRLNDEVFGPYKNQKDELPIAAALLLVCKGRAEVVNC